MLHVLPPLDIWLVCILVSYIMHCHECMINTLAVKCYECILQFSMHCTLTIVSCHLLPTPTAVCTQSKRAHWCNSHFIHCTKIEVGDSVWGCIRAIHWASGVRGDSLSPVLHRVTSDHLTRSQTSSAPSDSDLARFIQCHHWHTSRRRLKYICWREWWSLDKQWALYRILCFVSPNFNTLAIPQLMQEKLTQKLSYTNQTVLISVLAICSSM